jgi:hypothetical protein
MSNEKLNHFIYPLLNKASLPEVCDERNDAMKYFSLGQKNYC